MSGVYFSGKKLLDIASRSDKIIVKDIDIVGTKNITKAEIKELLPFKIGDNLLKINLSEAEEEIKKLKPELKKIVIKRRWQKVKVRLYERTPEAFVVCNSEKEGIDFDNRPFPLRGFMSAMKVPKIIYQSDGERWKILNFIKRFKRICGEFLDNISEIKFSSTGDLIFVMNSNTVIFWGDEIPERLSPKFKKFQKIYVDAMAKYKQIEYIDMTLYCSGKATVKPYK
ncbi:MAG: FtsQ-type POTRA domain-containing protein [Endomicrobium sp.]|nr:FtsQ-type POTRA domain-containing protein [Endomicrobium sp.]